MLAPTLKFEAGWEDQGSRLYYTYISVYVILKTGQ